MPIEVPPDVDTSHPNMFITGPGTPGKTLEATGAHTAAWTGGGGGGGSQKKLGIPEEQLEPPAEGTPTVVSATFDALVYLSVHLKVAAVNGQALFFVSGNSVYEFTEPNTIGPVTMLLAVPAGESWEWAESVIGGQVKFEKVDYQLFDK
jgi:hypothetical protein